MVVSNSASFKGKIGEKKVKNTLKRLNHELYISIHDLYIPIENGKKTSQVDHLVLSQTGIYVIETKNYKGWITGSEQSQYWNQTNYKRKDKFNNPIWQNYGHIQALKSYLGDLVENVPFFSIIVFGDQSELKFKSEFKNASVIKRNRLIGVINDSSKPNILSQQQLRKIQHKIEPLVNISNVEKIKWLKIIVMKSDPLYHKKNKALKIMSAPDVAIRWLKGKENMVNSKGAVNILNVNSLHKKAEVFSAFLNKVYFN